MNRWGIVAWGPDGGEQQMLTHDPRNGIPFVVPNEASRLLLGNVGADIHSLAIYHCSVTATNNLLLISPNMLYLLPMQPNSAARARCLPLNSIEAVLRDAETPCRLVVEAKPYGVEILSTSVEEVVGILCTATSLQCRTVGAPRLACVPTDHTDFFFPIPTMADVVRSDVSWRLDAVNKKLLYIMRSFDIRLKAPAGEGESTDGISKPGAAIAALRECKLEELVRAVGDAHRRLGHGEQRSPHDADEASAVSGNLQGVGRETEKWRLKNQTPSQERATTPEKSFVCTPTKSPGRTSPSIASIVNNVVEPIRCSILTVEEYVTRSLAASGSKESTRKITNAIRVIYNALDKAVRIKDEVSEKMLPEVSPVNCRTVAYDAVAVIRTLKERESMIKSRQQTAIAHYCETQTTQQRQRQTFQKWRSRSQETRQQVRDSHGTAIAASLRAATDTRDRSLLETMEAERRALQDQVAKHAADVKLLAAERDASSRAGTSTATKERQLEAVGATAGGGGDVSVRGASDRWLSVDAGARVRELEEQAALRASEAATVGEKLRESETARAQLESQLRSNISGQAVAAAELTKERRAVEELQRQLGARAHEAAEATAKCSELSEQLSHRDEVVASLRAASNTRDRSLLETMEAERRALQDQVAKHAADVKLLSEQLAAEKLASRNHSSREDETKSLLEVINDLENECAALREARTTSSIKGSQSSQTSERALLDVVLDLENETTRAKLKIQALQSESNKGRQAVEQLQRQLDARTYEATEATARCSQLSEQLSHRDEVVATLRAASDTRDRSLLETMEAERRALQDQVAKHAADVKLLNEQLAAERDASSRAGASAATKERQLEAVGATAGGGGDVSVCGTSDRGLSVDAGARVRELEEQAALRASEAATVGEKLRESETARAQLESQLRSNISGQAVAAAELTKERRAVEELQRQLDARAHEAAEATAKCSELSEQLSHRDEVVASLRAASNTRDRSLLETMEAERRALQDQVAKHAADVKLLSEQLAAERDASSRAGASAATKERQLEAVGATAEGGGDVSVRGTSDRGLSVNAGARVRELEEQAALRASEAATVGEKLRESETARAQLESQLRSNISGQAVAAAELTKERRAVEELQRQLGARAHEAAEATAKCSELSEQLSHRDEVVASLRAESNTRDRSLLETMEAERRALQDQVAKHAADVKLLSEQLAAERDASSRAGASAATKERQLEAVGATAGGGGDVSVRGTSDRGLCVDTSARVRELEEQAALRASEAATVGEKLRESETARAQLESQLRSNISGQAVAAAELTKERRAVEELQRQLGARAHEAAEATAKCTELSEQLSHRDEVVASLRAESNTRDRSLLETMEAERRALQDQVAKHAADVKLLSEQLAAERDRAARVSVSPDKQPALIDVVADLEDELSQCRSKEGEMKKRMNEEARRYDESHSALSAVHEKVAMQERRLSEQAATIEQLQRQLEAVGATAGGGGDVSVRGASDRGLSVDTSARVRELEEQAALRASEAATIGEKLRESETARAQLESQLRSNISGQAVAAAELTKEHRAVEELQRQLGARAQEAAEATAKCSELSEQLSHRDEVVASLRAASNTRDRSLLETMEAERRALQDQVAKHAADVKLLAAERDASSRAGASAATKERQLEAVGATAGGGGDVSVRGTSDRGLSVDAGARVRELEEQAALRASEAATVGEKLRESETARAQLESQLRSNISGQAVAAAELTKERRAVEELQRQLGARAQEAAEATAKCSELSEQLSHRDEVVASLRAASNTRDRSLLETMEAERRALQDQVAKHAADVKLLSEQLAAERDASSRAGASAATKERQLEAVGATAGGGGDVSVRGTSDRGLSVNADARVRELEEQAALRASEAATVGEKLRESETARAQLESQLRSNISGQAVAAAELTKERRAVEELQRQLGARAHEAAEATAKCTELSEQLSHRDEVVASLRAASNTRDRSLLETMEAERRALQVQVAKHAADVKLLSEQLAAERDRAARVSVSPDKQPALIDVVADLEDELSQCRSKEGEMKKRMNEEARRYDESRSALSAVHEKVAMQERRLSEQAATIEQLQRQLEAVGATAEGGGDVSVRGASDRGLSVDTSATVRKLDEQAALRASEAATIGEKLRESETARAQLESQLRSNISGQAVAAAELTKERRAVEELQRQLGARAHEAAEATAKCSELSEQLSHRDEVVASLRAESNTRDRSLLETMEAERRALQDQVAKHAADVKLLSEQLAAERDRAARVSVSPDKQPALIDVVADLEDELSQCRSKEGEIKKRMNEEARRYDESHSALSAVHEKVAMQERRLSEQAATIEQLQRQLEAVGATAGGGGDVSVRGTSDRGLSVDTSARVRELEEQAALRASEAATIGEKLRESETARAQLESQLRSNISGQAVAAAELTKERRAVEELQRQLGARAHEAAEATAKCTELSEQLSHRDEVVASLRAASNTRDRSLLETMEAERRALQDQVAKHAADVKLLSEQLAAERDRAARVSVSPDKQPALIDVVADLEDELSQCRSKEGEIKSG